MFAESLGKGESSCLSIAVSRDLKVLTDDMDARELAQRRGYDALSLSALPILLEVVEMAEAEVRFKVPRGLKEEMEGFPEVEWSEIAKETFLQEVKRQVLLRKFIEFIPLEEYENKE